MKSVDQKILWRTPHKKKKIKEILRVPGHWFSSQFAASFDHENKNETE